MDIIISIAAIIAVLLIGIAWGGSGKGRGALSAFLNLVCVVVAGAFAFGAWEFIVNNALFAATDGSGFLGDIAWAIGLLIPFAIILLVLKLVADAFVPANIDLDDPINMAGGVVFGGLSGAITVGICLIGISSSNIGPSLLGHKHVEDDRGSLLYNNSLLVPFDDLTIALYENLSLYSFSSSNGLARTRPDANVQFALARNVFESSDKQRARLNITSDDAEILGRYLVQGQSLNEILDDSLGSFPQAPKAPNGETTKSGSSLYGYVVKLNAGAKDTSGQTIVGPGIVRLVATPSSGKALGIQPVAIIARAQAESQLYRRYKMDDKDRFVPSAGAGAESYFAFEFPVPADYTPSHLIIKNMRFPLDGLNETASQTTNFQGYAPRDAALNSGVLLTQFGVPGGQADFSDFNLATAVVFGSSEGINSRTSIIPSSIALTRGQTGGLAVSSENNQIIGGQHTFALDATKAPAGPLRVDRFAFPRAANLVVLELVDSNGQLTTLGQAVARGTGEIAVVSSGVERFPAIGYVYGDSGTVSIRYTPSDVIDNIGSELPGAIQSAQQCFLIFHVTRGSDIKYIVSDDNVLVDYQPAVTVTQTGRSRN